MVQKICSEIISTYALCGFANLGSIGVQLGGLGPMAPHRVTDMSKIAIRALFAGTIACFMTACVAGVLYDESLYEGAVAIGTLAPNVTATIASNPTTIAPTTA
ncbi:solute carrier family 28 member 3-like [Nematostella vectensis]|uniref:solute carrier family 28 member 3-like n=1 Tax=Nematostella vectensis TaxID=45351 RepID=UPI0020773091|nr:solute carrier family 28 member 3-like [Nematostella vectensis]XP_048577916.1 solute carrier family 28 member 3-like [Nematostella vectensis]